MIRIDEVNLKKQKLLYQRHETLMREEKGLPGLPAGIAARLSSVGITTIDGLKRTTVEELCQMQGIGAAKLKIIIDYAWRKRNGGLPCGGDSQNRDYL